MIDASQPPIRLLLHVPKDSFTPPEGKDLYDRVIPLLEKAGEIAKDTGRAYGGLSPIAQRIRIL